MTPERLFERSWAIAVLNQVLLRLENEYAKRGKTAVFQALRHLLDGQADAKSHAEIARQLGTSESAVRVMAHRLRRRYRRLLREEIIHTVANEELVDEEIQHFLECL
jgi:RNA polymerase sigma-70 factor (ECF subfamily)